MLQQAASIMISEAQRDEYGNIKKGGAKKGGAGNEIAADTESPSVSSLVAMPTLMRIMEDVFISSIDWLRQSSARVVRLGITHIVISE